MPLGVGSSNQGNRITLANPRGGATPRGTTFAIQENAPEVNGSLDRAENGMAIGE